MTNEDAIKILEDSKAVLEQANNIYGMHDFEQAKEAFILAIEALKKADCPYLKDECFWCVNGCEDEK